MVDRSITVFILLNLDQAEKTGMDVNTIKDRLKNQRTLDKRFEGLKETGVIRFENGRVYLSEEGKLSAKIFLYDVKLLNIHKEYEKFADQSNAKR